MRYLSKVDLMFHLAKRKMHLIIDGQSVNAKMESYAQSVKYLIAIEELEV